MEIIVDKRAEKVLNKFPKLERSKVSRVIWFFNQNGFSLTEIHLKKLTKIIWELRAGPARLLFGMSNGRAIIVDAFIKKTQQTPINEINIADKRLAEYL